MACPRRNTRETHRRTIADKTDEVLIRNLQNIDDTGTRSWYEHYSPLHRYYLRACREEARKRGLKLPEFNPYV